MQLAASACKVCMQLAPVAYKLYPSGGQSHANYTRVAASRMQHEYNRPKFACDWRPLGYNLHATGSHSVTRQDTSRQELCKRPSLHRTGNYIFLALASPHPPPCFWLFSWRPLDIWFGKCAGTMNDKATEANFVRASGQLRAKPPVFCQHAARTIIKIKKWRRHCKAENLRDTCP